MTMLAAVDFGYSSIKASVDDQFIFQPSVVARRPSYLANDPVDADDYDFSKLINEMDVTISSKSIAMDGRYYVGVLANSSTLELTSMQTSSRLGKYQSDLPIYITLASLATRAVQEAALEGLDLSNVKVDAVLATALPVSEGSSKTIRDDYSRRFVGVHQVHFNNFTSPVSVTLNVTRAAILQEGVAGQLFLANRKSELLPSVSEDLTDHYGTQMGEAASEVLDQRNTMTIDIGQGTTDFVVGLNGVLVQNASTSLDQGYGTVLDASRIALRQEGYVYDSNQELIAYLNKRVPSYKAGEQKTVKKIVADQLDPFARRIAQEAEKVASHASVSRQVDVIYVFGGGSIPLDESSRLREYLMETSARFGLGPVVFISRKYAQKLNLLGLEIFVKHLTN